MSSHEQKAKFIRLRALEKTVEKNRGHLGGTYSCTDLLVALYYEVLNIGPRNPKLDYRDRFILSKGHACLALYAILVDVGFIKEDVLNTYGNNGGLGVQLDVSIPGVDWNTGSLGHALGVTSGMALAAKLDNKNYFAYSILGDAEFDEGSIWEAIAFASDHNLNNLICIVDRNRLSVTEVLEDNAIFRNLGSIMESFGWHYQEIDGHSFPEILEALENAQLSDRPSLILANTVKGKGVSFMENGLKWHHSVPTKEEYEIAKKELS